MSVSLVIKLIHISWLGNAELYGPRLRKRGIPHRQNKEGKRPRPKHKQNSLGLSQGFSNWPRLSLHIDPELDLDPVPVPAPHPDQTNHRRHLRIIDSLMCKSRANQYQYQLDPRLDPVSIFTELLTQCVTAPKVLAIARASTFTLK